jgi:NAD(P)H-dependent FMN reductase
MKQVLGLIASPRQLGNCEIMVKEISRQLAIPHRLQLLRLTDFRLRYCNGCYRCLSRGGCVLGDGLQVILEAIAAADALILAAPTYFLGAHACLKVFVDRGLSFYAMAERLWGKPAVGIGVAGIEGKEGCTLLDLERFFLTLQADNRMTRVLYAALPGEVVLSEANRQAAAELAAALFGEPALRRQPRCPLCGGTTIRFLDDGRVRCMLCSNTGTLVAGPEGPTLEIARGRHEFITDQNAALQHQEWLKGMLARYRERREPLKEIKSGYQDETPWVKPSGAQEEGA